MSKKPSLAEALTPLDRSAAHTTQAVIERPKREATKLPPSRAGKRALISYHRPEVSKQLRQLALDRETTVQDLVAEAVNDLFQKYHKPTLA
jgi:hypothetical protein